MVGFEVQKQGKYVNILPDRVKNSDLEVLTKEIKECVSSIKDISMPKSGGMYTTVYKDKSFSSAIRTMLNNLQFYTINIDNTLFLIDGTFHNVNVSFPDGNLGLINVIKMAEEAKICFL